MARHFQYVGLSGEQSFMLSQVLASSIKTRIMSGKDVNDRPAPALSKTYSRLKLRRGRQAIRDWALSGETMSALVPLHGMNGQIVVGFSNPRSAAIAAIQNSRCQQFGVSPQDRQKVIEALRQIQNQLVRIAA